MEVNIGVINYEILYYLFKNKANALTVKISSPIIEMMPNGEPIVITKPPSSFQNKRRIVILVAVLGFITILLLNYFGLIKLGKPPLARVANTSIASKDVDKQIKLTWGVYSQQETIKPDSRKAVLEDLIEQEIVAQEARKLGVSVSSQEIDKNLDERVKQVGNLEKYQAILKTNGWSMQDQRGKIQAEILKEKVKDKVISWRLIDAVSAYLDPLDKNYAIKKTAVIPVLNKAGNLLSQGARASEAADEAARTQNVFKSFVTSETRRVEKKDNWERVILEGIFKLSKGQVSQVLISQSETSFWVVRIVDGNDTNFSSFNDWLEVKKKEYVK